MEDKMRHIVLNATISGAALSFTVFVVGLASADTYSVGPGRTYSALQDVRTLLQPGDVVEIDGDASYVGGVVLDRPGNAERPITIRGLRVNGKRPVLSGGTNTLEVRADHYVIVGLELTRGSSRCFYHRGDDVVLRDSEIHDCPSQGILGADGNSGSLLMEFVEVHHCGSGTQAHQIYMATDETAHPGSVFRMQHCYVHDGNGGNNIKSRAERNEIYCNWVEGAMYHELELIGPDDGVGNGGAREDSDVVGNVLLKQASTYVVRFGGDGTGETQGRYRFVNNTVITQSGGSEVFRLFDALESLEVHNNVFFALDGGTVNVLRDAEANWTHGRQIVGTNNWVGPAVTKIPIEWTGTVQGSNPGFASLDTLQLAPVAGSPLVDAGASDTAAAWAYAVPNPRMLPDCVPPTRMVSESPIRRPSIGSIDIGAYEFGAGTARDQSRARGASSGTGGATGGGSGGTHQGGQATTARCGCRVHGAGPQGSTTLWVMGIAWAFLGCRRRTHPIDRQSCSSGLRSDVAICRRTPSFENRDAPILF